eukprot:GCRY01001993.1.p1 GENE.GCRY01001993.1~~GCRY01001993.1.p1  ORF type:complete len:335 (+),score=59.33 GCRY01001993.1:113-1117(+)
MTFAENDPETENVVVTLHETELREVAESAPASKPPVAQKQNRILFEYISLFSFLGVFIRWALNTQITGHFDVIGMNFVSNSVGSFLMGLLVAEKSQWGEKHKGIALGFTTGMCGCITTFGGWINSISQHLIHNHVDFAVMSLVAGFCSFYVLFCAGKGLSSAFLGPFWKWIGKASSNRGPFHVVFAGTSAALWGLFFTLAYFNTAECRVLWTGLLFAPLGACIRGGLVNPPLPLFPHGTFACNLTGSLLTALVSLALHLSDLTSAGVIYVADADVAVALWMGVGLGFTGALSTVSTFMNEIHNLSVPQRCRYVLPTVLLSGLLCAAVHIVIYFT